MSTERPVAFFLPSLVGGGAERVTVNLATAVTERGRPVDMVLAAAKGVFLQELAPAIRVVDLGAGRVLTSVVPLARYLRNERPKVLVSSMGHANLIALWAGRLAGGAVPIVVTEHNTLSQEVARQRGLTRWMWPRLLGTFYPWADGIIAVSRAAADDLARTADLRRDDIEVVYNPVITPALLAGVQGTPEHPWFGAGQPPVVLGVGRLTRQKDFPNLIRAVAEVRRRRPVRLLILGEGEDRTALEALVAELGLGNDVALPGFAENALAYMARSAAFVLSSAWEGLPTVLIEALAAGTRVVSTDCPSGPREILRDGHLGALVPVGDPRALAAAIEQALDATTEPPPLDALKPFTRDAAVDHYLAIIDRVAGAAGQARTRPSPSPERAPHGA